jgi:hypothetical protein
MPGAVGQVTLLDLTYTIDDAAGVGQFVAVVQGAADGSCKKPAAANAAAFLGFTKTAQAKQNKGVSVARMGIARALAKGAITRGDRLNIATNAGDVQSVEAAVAGITAGAAAIYNVVGTAENSTVNDGDIVYVKINPFSVVLPVS